MALIRVLRTAGATLTRTVYIDETPTDVTGNMTVTVTRLDGTAVAGPTTATHGTTGVYLYALPGGPSAPGSATWQLDTLDVTWTGTVGSAVVTMTDQVEVVGGFYFGLAEVRASDPSLSDTVKYPTAALALRRLQVEQDAEEIMQRAWVPRFRRVLLNGSGHDVQLLPDKDIRLLRAASVSWVTGQPLVALTADDLADIVPTAEGTLCRLPGFPWPQGIGNVLVEYEYGMDFPPEGLRQAAMTYLRTRLNMNRTGVAPNALSYTTPEGTFRMAVPTAYATGIPDVDALFARWASPPGGFA